MREQYFQVLCHDAGFKTSACGIHQDILILVLMRFIRHSSIFAILDDDIASRLTYTTLRCRNVNHRGKMRTFSQDYNGLRISESLFTLLVDPTYALPSLSLSFLWLQASLSFCDVPVILLRKHLILKLFLEQNLLMTTFN